MTTRSSIDTSQRGSNGSQVQEMGLLSTFHAKVKELNDSYISFFNERMRLEEEYIQGLSKLYDTATKIDFEMDTKYDMTSVRHVWKEIRQGLDRERQAKDSFKHAIQSDVINPLSTFRDTHERTRRRVKEDIKSSSSDYNDYRETVQKLKKTYEKKYSELETHQKQSAAVDAQARLLQNSSYIHPTQSNSSTASDETPKPTSRPMSPDSTTTASAGKEMIAALKTKDWASGKRHFNSLFKNIGNDHDRDSKIIEDPTSINSGPKPSAIKTAKAKREVDEADQSYRQAVFHLESLRLQRERLQGAAFVSLSEFIEALSDQMRARLICYADHHISNVKTHDSLAHYVRDTVERIDPEKDLASFKSRLPDDPASWGIPPRYLYVNHIGESFELVFGVKLSDLAMTCGTGDNPPRVVSQAIWALGQKGVKTEGLYRISSRQAAVAEMVRRVEKDYANFEITPYDEPHSIAGLLKLYLRQLPEPLFRCSLSERVQHTDTRQKQFAESFPLLKSKLRKLPTLTFSTLRLVIEHLALVAHFEPFNKMNATSLAIVFQPVIMGDINLDDLQGMNAEDALKMQHSAAKDKTMEDLILYYKTIFDNEPLTWANPPQNQKPILKRTNTVATNNGNLSRSQGKDVNNLNNEIDVQTSPQSQDLSNRASTQIGDFSPRAPTKIREQFQVLGRRASQMRNNPSRQSHRRSSGSGNELELNQNNNSSSNIQSSSPITTNNNNFNFNERSSSQTPDSRHRYNISESILPYASPVRKFSLSRKKKPSPVKDNHFPSGAGYEIPNNHPQQPQQPQQQQQPKQQQPKQSHQQNSTYFTSQSNSSNSTPQAELIDSNSIIEAYESSPKKLTQNLPE